jgi:hypothetical protein
MNPSKPIDISPHMLAKAAQKNTSNDAFVRTDFTGTAAAWLANFPASAYCGPLSVAIGST